MGLLLTFTHFAMLSGSLWKCLEQMVPMSEQVFGLQVDFIEIAYLV